MNKLEIKIGDIYGCWQVMRLPEKVNGSKLNYCLCKCVECDEIERYVRYTDLIHERIKCKCQRKHNYNITKPQPIRNKSFKDWCEETNHLEFLDRWDYDLNKYDPDVVSYKSEYNIYFKCPAKKHKSQMIKLRYITDLNTSCDCKECYLEENSFGLWCKNNNPSILDLWDYEKNKVSPYEVLRASNQKYYFKCPRNLHDSHLQIICNITLENASIRCEQCNSIGQWIVDNYGVDFLQLFWDYSLNKKSPFEISFCSHTMVYVKCLSNPAHPSYPTQPQRIVKGNGCPTCKSENGTSKLQTKVQRYISEKYGCHILYEHACLLKPINPKTGYALPYDNQVVVDKQNNLIIEVMGIQHFEAVGFVKQAAQRHGVTPEAELLEIQWRDEYKKQYALSNGYWYLSIPYWTEKDQSYKKLIDDKIHEILSTIQND